MNVNIKNRPLIENRPLIVLTLILVPGIGWMLWPALDLSAWEPPPVLEPQIAAVPLAGLLQSTIALGPLRGMEDIDRLGGRLVGGARDGTLAVIGEGPSPTPIGSTGGRPLGLAPAAADEGLWVADAVRGLLFVASDGRTRPAIAAGPGGRLSFANGLDTAADGTVYLTDSSRLFERTEITREFIAHRPTGRLLKYDARTSTLQTILDKLSFANGVIVAPDQSWVMVAETSAYRVTRYWLQGPRKGRAETVLDGLPGLTDNIFTHDHCTYWVALFQPRSELLDALLPYPLLRAPLLRLPLFALQSVPGPSALLGFDHEGTVHHYIVDKEKRFTPISGGFTDGQVIYIGSLEASEVGVARIPPPAASKQVACS